MENSSGKKSRVCVLGATGYVGSHVVAALLSEGHPVAAGVRDPSAEAISCLRALPGSDQLSIFKVDILSEDSVDLALDAVMTGCEYVIHCASPNPAVKTVKGEAAQHEVVEPLVEMVENVITACAKAKKFKRLVFLSSFAAMANGENLLPNYTYSEKDWNETSGLETPLGAYNHAKALAEQAAWVLARNNNVEMVSICPYAVFGPSLVPRKSASMYGVKQMLEGAFAEGAPPVKIGVVDVREVATACVKAMLNPAANKRRFLLARPTMVTFLQVCNAMNYTGTLGEYRLPKEDIPIWKYMKNRALMGAMLASHTIDLDTTPAEMILGLKYRPLEETMADSAQSAIDHDFVHPPTPMAEQVANVVKLTVLVGGAGVLAYYALKYYKTK